MGRGRVFFGSILFLFTGFKSEALSNRAFNFVSGTDTPASASKSRISRSV